MTDREFEHALERHFDEMHEDAFGDDIPLEEPEEIEPDFYDKEDQRETDEFIERCGVQF